MMGIIYRLSTRLRRLTPLVAVGCLAGPLLGGPGAANAGPEGAEGRPQDPTAAQIDTLGVQSTSLDSLEAKFNRKRLTRMLSDYVFVGGGGLTDEARLSPDGGKIIKSTDPYERYEGAIIRTIAVARLDIFTGVSADTTPNDQPWLYRTGNAVHVNTRAKKVLSYLLFTEGDRLDPGELADSERILRNTPFIQDARIAVVPITGIADSVDVLVVTRDVWSIGVTASVKTASRFKLGVYDRNLFGQGHSLDNEFDVDTGRSQELNYKLTYTMDNIWATFINGLLQYRNAHTDETVFGGFSRGFISPQIRWAGALNVSFSALKNDLALVTERISLQDFWIGRSFQLGRKRSRLHSRKTFVIAARSIRTKFQEHPEVDPRERTYNDRTFYLGSLSLSKSDFRKARLILDFGRTEDIPSGYLLDVTAGYELARGVRDREYMGAGLRAGGYLGKLGYFSGGAQMGTFILDGLTNETVIETRAGYFSNLIRLRRFALRQFFLVRYTLGLRRTDTIRLDDEAGIRGLNNVGLDGLERFIGRFQTVLFTPWSTLGFKTAIFVEGDIGAIGPKHETFDNQRFYTGWGLGLRIGNERLVFDPIEIRVNVYPSSPDGQQEIRFFFTNVRDFPILGFASSAPSVVGFR